MFKSDAQPASTQYTYIWCNGDEGEEYILNMTPNVQGSFNSFK